MPWLGLGLAQWPRHDADLALTLPLPLPLSLPLTLARVLEGADALCGFDAGHALLGLGLGVGLGLG